LYLFKQNQTFHYRARVPADLIPILGKRELRFSLKTGDRKQAKKLTWVVTQRSLGAFNKVRLPQLEVCAMIEQGTLTREKLNELMRTYVIEEINHFDKWQAERKPSNPYAFEREMESFEVALIEARDSLSECQHVAHASRQVDFLLKEAGLPLDKGSDEYKRICWEVLKANIRVMEANRSRLLGYFEGNDPESVMRDLGIDPGAPVQEE